MVKVTKCPVGYAYGYTPINGSNELEDLRQDTLEVCHSIRMHALMSTRFNGGKMPAEIIRKMENRFSWQIFSKSIHQSASNQK